MKQGSVEGFIFFLHVATAPNGLGPSHYGCVTIILRHTTCGIGLLWMSDRPVAENST